MPGQTLSEIRALLAAAGLSPQHRFGQNFLIDLNLMRKLVAAAELSPGDVVLEVGPGTGSLTELLLDAGVRVVAVEIDRGFQAILRERLGTNQRFTLVQGDALAGKHRVNPLVLHALEQARSPHRPEADAPRLPPGAGGAYKLVANLPYQIATPLLMDLLLATPAFERLTCTIQKEVAERLVAAPRTEAYGTASVMVQLMADVTAHAILPPTVFWPRPQVESAMVTIRPRAVDRESRSLTLRGSDSSLTLRGSDGSLTLRGSDGSLTLRGSDGSLTLRGSDARGTDGSSGLHGGASVTDAEAKRYYAELATFVQTAFQQRRKRLRRLFRDWNELEVQAAFRRAGVSPDARPEELSPSAWPALHAAVQRRPT